MSIWLQFIICAGVILFAGANLSRYGDIIAEKSGLGRTWIGVVLMASVTSLPELITGLSSVTLVDVPDIAVGDVLGSCMFNLLIIAFLDLICGPTPISSQIQAGQVLTAAFSTLLLSLVALSLIAGERLMPLGWFGLYSPIILVLYLAAMRAIFRYEQRRISEYVEELAEEAQYNHITAAQAYRGYAFNSILIVGAAVYLPYLGAAIAELTGLGQSFIGSALVALSTSLPEVVVSIAALRIGAVDMAVGNLFGSNLFNLAILALDDLLYLKGPLLSVVAGSHLVAAVAAIAMTSMAMIGVTYRATKKFFFFAWDALGMAMVYLLAMILIYQLS